MSARVWHELLDASRASLAALCPELASELDAAAAEALAPTARLLARVTEWNKRLDLTSARDERQLVDLYWPDALVLAAAARRELAQRTHTGMPVWLDVGSGGGAPGLVLALLEPRLLSWLVDARAKRVTFLRSSAGALGLERVRIEQRRVETLPAGCCDVALSRATFPPEEWLQHGARLARRGVWVLLARGEEPTLTGWRPAQRIDYRWPLGGAERRALFYTRT